MFNVPIQPSPAPFKQVHVTTLRKYFGANLNMLAATFPLHRWEAQPLDEHY